MICIGRGQEKLKVAGQLGSDSLVSIKQDGFEEEVRAVTEGHYGPDVVIESVGTPETWQLATRLVRKGGRVLLYGGCTKGTRVSLDTHRVHYEELTIAGVFHHTPKHFRSALDLIAKKKVEIGALLCREVELAKLTSIFKRGAEGNPLKIVVSPYLTTRS